jgi:serine kinase of HPr protein (carbohydrate metabolism regulator)
MSRLHHASCVEFERIGILLRGPAGAGKSDLALRLIEAGATLIADDQVVLEARGGRLIARPPEALAGLIEVRGLGIVVLPYGAETAIGLAVELSEFAAHGEIERLPEATETAIDDVAVPSIGLMPFEPSAVAKVRIAAKLVSGRLRTAETALGRGLTQHSA